MDARALARRIPLGEDSALEFKSVRLSGGRVAAPERGGFADELAAMANWLGGTVILGVDDATRAVDGISPESIDDVERWAREICNDSVRPALNADILKMELEDSAGQSRAVIRIDVPRSLFVHESPGGYFVKIGSSRRKMLPDTLARLFEERSSGRHIRFDESPVPGTALSHLHYRLAKRFASGGAEWISTAPAAAEDEMSTEFLRKLRIVAEYRDGVDGLTVSGVLLCTEEPQRWLPHACVQAVAYAGERTDTNYQTDARDIGGPIDEQVADALHFLRRNMFVRGSKRMARSERPQFSERAVFEALVNAVAHRDYSMHGARVRMHLFSDRLELYVPGALTNTMTPDSLHLRQSSRNELVVSLLARCRAPSGLGRTRMMDRRGDGVPIILKECETLSGRRPEYAMVDDSELRLIMWAAM